MITMSMGYRFLALSALVILLSAVTPAEAQPVVLRFGVVKDPPGRSPDIAVVEGKAVGMNVDLINAIFSEAGLEWTEVLFDPMSSARRIAVLTEGAFDFIAAATPSAEREKIAYFSVPYRSENVGLLVRKGASDSLPMATLKDFAKLPETRMAAVQGAYYGPAFAALLQDPEMSKRIDLIGASPEIRLRLLLSGRDQFVVGESFTLLFNARQLGYADQVEIHPLVIDSSPICLMFSRKTVSPSVVERVNRAITSLQARGDIERILGTYRK